MNRAPSQDVLCKWVLSIANERSREAFGELFDYFAPRLKTYFLKTGISPEQAEDVVQDVMIQVWRKAGQYNSDRATVASWVFMIARSRLIDGLRKTRAPELDPDDPVLQPPATKPPEVKLQSKETSLKLRELIRELPEEQQTVLRASFYQGLSHSEIAKRFDLPLGTVKSRLRLAVSAMRNDVPDLLPH